MLKQGVPEAEVFKSTGTTRGLDNAFRQEITDENALVKGTGKFGDIYEQRKAAYGVTTPTVEEIMRHPELFAAYPQLKGNQVMLLPATSKNNASYSPTEGIIRVNPNLTADQATSSMLHELQHGVQEKEGFAKGGSVEGVVKEANKEAEEIAKKLNEMPYGSPQYEETYKKFLEKRQNITVDQAQDMYKRLAGEAEARAVQSRMNMTDAERRAKFPYQSYDVPINELIVRK
jgi:hypothetical protein